MPQVYSLGLNKLLRLSIQGSWEEVPLKVLRSMASAVLTAEATIWHVLLSYKEQELCPFLMRGVKE